MKLAFLAASALTLSVTAAHAATSDPGFFDYDGGADYIATPSNVGPLGPLPTPSGPSVGGSFEGISQYNTAAFGRNFIPPDTMGAVGTTQFMETSNGAYAIYAKTGALQSMVSDTAFWAKAGMAGANGDSRVLFDAQSQRWLVESFAANLDTIQIAVSDTSDAMGGWKSTSFAGFAGGIADYPTLAIDSKAVYIGTNDFNAAGTAFFGTTMSVINRNDLFGGGAPNTSSLQQFFTPYGSEDRGWSIQAVNQLSGSPDSGKVLTDSIFTTDLVTYNILNPGSGVATQTAIKYLGTTPYDQNDLGRQPYTTGTGNPRVIDTLDDRVSSAVWEVNGIIYAVHTVTPTGTDHTAVVWTLTNAATGVLMSQGTIAEAGYDIFQGSIAVNPSGQVVIGYNRSGTSTVDGKISFYVATFDTTVGGQLFQTGTELIHVSDTDSYHNGSTDGKPASGRQRWGDYSQVTLDPTDDQSFWAIGEFAREFNDAANGHPGGTGGSRWGTWITDINLTPILAAVPEPGTWAMMLVGFGGLGAALRSRRRRLAATAV